MIDRIMSSIFKTADNMKVTPGKIADKTQQKPFTLDQNLVLDTTKELTKTNRSAQSKATEPVPLTDRLDQLPFVPLPLRTPLYEDTQFYWKLKDFGANVDETGEAKVVFSINSDFLGLLCFSVTSQTHSSLAVQCVTENNATAELFKNHTTILQQELSELGYANVVVTCRVQPGLRGIADLDPAFANQDKPTLLNVQV